MGKTRIFATMAIAVLLCVATNAFAQMGGDHHNGGMGGDHNGNGRGHGMHGAGDMVSGMMENTTFHEYRDTLNPITSPDEARIVIQRFINFSNSALQISELWEYGTAYKAELSDATGAKAFDVIADKFTGAVSPEMGFSMMRNASYGKGLYRTKRFKTNLTITADQAQAYAQAFIENNGLGYNIGTPEIYPGYYKFHTTNAGEHGMDIMVNGYDGRIWMNTLLGVPQAEY